MAINALENAFKERQIEKIDLDKIDLDINNPRFGNGEFDVETSQPEIVNFIVKNFGVDDVLSSLAVNGYFAAEPIVCRKNGDRFTVLEGNRRVTAMFILAGDARAVAHEDRATRYRALHEEHGTPPFDPVPAIVFESNDKDKTLLSYLGVRHIVSTRDWDSFAKANWVHSTIEDGELTIEDVSTMTGDNRQTVRKLLQGYNYVKQLEIENLFDPSNSNKGGRGSNTKYPFSWVYTLLGYKDIKDFLSLSEDPTEKNPIPNNSLEHAALLLKAMFGDRSKGKDSQVGDSRNLSDLVSAVKTKDKLRLLKEGKHVKDIEALTKPVDERLDSIFYSIQELLAEANDRLIREKVTASKIPELKQSLEQLKRQFKSLDNSLNEQLSSNGENDW